MNNLNYLHETIKGTIVWINNQKNIPESVKNEKIHELVTDLNETGCSIEGTTCYNSRIQGTCLSLMNLSVTLEGEGTWTCPVCGAAKKAVQILGTWYEDQE